MYNIIRLQKEKIRELSSLYLSHDISEVDVNSMINRRLDEITTGKRISFICTTEKEIIGEGSLGFEYDEADFTIKDNRVCLSMIIVKKGFNNKGVATSILDELFSYAKSKGYKEMSLEVNVTNYNALHLFVRNDFTKIIGTIKDQDSTTILLLKNL